MKFSTLAALGVAQAHSLNDQVEQQYIQYLAQHGKSYGTAEEYKFRLAIFADKLEQVKAYNAESTGTDAVLGMNFMADWTDAEYKKVRGYKQGASKAQAKTIFVGNNTAVPASVDWVTAGAVTPVKNQGSCGSCWAFSTTGGMEGRYQLAGHDLTSFSEQQFVDCSSAQGNEGCNGGLMDQAFTYAEATAIDTEAAYPYTGKDGTCTIPAAGVTKVKGFTDVKTNDPVALEAAVAEGPVSIAVDGASIGFQLYMGGIITRLCGTSLDHGVLAVGYGTDNGTDYWLVKNSWGASWGIGGYCKILKDTTKTGPGLCGLQSQPSFPTF